MARIVLRLGTRKSPLALAQSGLVARALEAAHRGLSVELVPMSTRGDRFSGELAPIGGKGLFTRELEAGLLDASLDLAVHSLKDLPVALPAGLRIAAYPERADARDALVSELAEDLAGLPAGGIVLTGSLRRQAQVLAQRPDLRVEAIRGNVETRIRLWRERRAAGLILACAGLERLRWSELSAHGLDPEAFVPAPGQGILALEVRAGSRADEACSVLDHASTSRAACAERTLVAEFGGDCTLPLAAWARAERGDDELRLTAVLATPDGARSARGESRGRDPEEVAAACARAMRDDGAEAVLAATRGNRAPPD